MPEKYVVFKIEDWEEFYVYCTGVTDRVHAPDPLEDAVVIRLQDMFAPPALDAYANSIMAAVAVLESELVLSGGSVSKKLEGLREIADYFHQQAEKAWNLTRKIPT